MKGDKLQFSVRIRRAVYGDRRVFREYKIIMWQDMFRRPVGSEDGPRRVHKTYSSAHAAAQKRIAELHARELYAVHVTEKCIQDGEANSCNTCAIAQAIWHARERMGLEDGVDFRIAPYACFADAEGIVLRDFYGGGEAKMADMPDLVTSGRRGMWHDSMMEWAMSWDDWARKRFMSAKEWREETGECAPSKPAPCSFVLDMTHFREQLAQEAAGQMKGAVTV